MRAPGTLPKIARLAVTLTGIVLGQVVLYGPSLVGRKVLLPLDILAGPGVYLPRTPDIAKIEPQNIFLTDPIFAFEPARRFAASEIHAGRFPMWNPYQFAGAPFISPKFSPFLALQYSTESPIVLAWSQLLAAIVAGMGAYLFFRRVLAVSFWPAAICAWCYPVTGFFVLWQGFPTGLSVVWLPWILLAVDRTARRTNRVAPIALAAVTCLTLASGELDVAGQVLLASGCFSLWCLWDAYRGQWFQRQARRAALALAGGWTLGLLLAAPAILPVLEYTQTGARIQRRVGGSEERPPVGMAALPQVVLPDMYGPTERGSFYIFPAGEQSLLESTAAGYTGMLATVLVAPLAWCSQRHRAMNVFWVLFAVFGLSWCLNLPGFVNVLRLPGLRMMSHVRLVFITSFAVLAMTAIGLEAFSQGSTRWRRWFWVPCAAVAGLFGWCVFRMLFLPEPIDTQLGLAVLQGHPMQRIHDLDGVRQVQAWFVRHYAAAAVRCGLGVIGWWVVWSQRSWQSRLLPALGALLLGDLLWFGYSRNQQSDPALYFPPIPVLQQVAKSTPGRIFGYSCLPPSLSLICDLRDIRGYDGVDPSRLIDLLAIASDPRYPRFDYALTQWQAPKAEITSESNIRLSPVLDMLGVRYVIFRYEPPPGTRPAFQGPDYWVLANPAALARVFIPRRVELVVDRNARLEKLSSPRFDPREVAYVESPVNLPIECRGTAEVVLEIPTHIAVSFRMETPGLVVLADLSDTGWQAYLEGKRAPILRTDHAIRGVQVPAGDGTLEFRYEPASFAWGLRLAGLAAVLLLGWLGFTVWKPKPAAVVATV